MTEESEDGAREDELDLGDGDQESIEDNEPRANGAELPAAEDSGHELQDKDEESSELNSRDQEGPDDDSIILKRSEDGSPSFSRPHQPEELGRPGETLSIPDDTPSIQVCCCSRLGTILRLIRPGLRAIFT